MVIGAAHLKVPLVREEVVPVLDDAGRVGRADAGLGDEEVVLFCCISDLKDPQEGERVQMSPWPVESAPQSFFLCVGVFVVFF